MPKKSKQRQEAVIFTLILYIIGIGLIASGYLVGAILFLPAFMFTVSLFPEVRDVIKSIVDGLRKVSDRKKISRQYSEMPPPPKDSQVTQVEAIARPSNINEIIADIEDFRAYRQPHSERELEDLLMQHLRGHYPALRTQLQYERTQIDAQIGNVGIEIKYRPEESDYDRLFGQVEKYLRHLPYIIVVIGFERSAESTEEFKKRLITHNWHNRVFVVIK